MKSITIHEPFASAIAFGYKKYETRSRKTNYRGPLAIHASKTFNSDRFTETSLVPWNEHFVLPLSRRYSGLGEADFSKGVIIAIVELVDCIEMDSDLIDAQSDLERSLGDWELGNYAYRLENIQTLKTPYKINGKQGLWNIELPDEALDGITIQEPE